MSVFHGSRFFCCHRIRFCMMDNTVKLRYARAGLPCVFGGCCPSCGEVILTLLFYIR